LFTGLIASLLLLVAGVLFLSQNDVSRGDVAFALAAFAGAVLVAGSALEGVALSTRRGYETERPVQYDAPRRTGTI